MKQRSLIAAFLALASLASIAGQTFQMDQKAYVPFERSLRMVGVDMKIGNCLDTGRINTQVPTEFTAR